MKTSLPLLLLLMFLFSCSQPEKNHRFIHKKDTGVTFTNELTKSAELNILNYLYYYNGAGVATGDFNNDGLVDIYFASNLNQDHLYLNLDNLKFQNITTTSGINNNSGWTTGVTTVDINNDGYLDIYVSKVSGHLHLKGSNLLYINQGLTDGIPTFKEEASTYQLNIEGLNTQTAFFDYDLDGDLDAYILSHSLYPNAYFGRGSQRTTRDTINGDKLLENRDGVFYDASAKANIYSSKIGYGLGINISDLNNDGYPDMYIGNDFFEDDYLYINNQDGTFNEINNKNGALGHTSHFSMGNDIADVNNDGLPDIISVDMLPEDPYTLKTSGAEYNYPIFSNNLKQGYTPQFMQNTLHINQGSSSFTESAFLSNVASSEWSWSPLLADFNNDGHKDLYITNGILGATNDMDFINFISNENIQKRLGKNMTDGELPLIEEMPSKKTVNYFFKNNGNGTFKNTSADWIKSKKSFSNGSTYADLDNDGDLDLIVNNVNEEAFILENKTNKAVTKANYLKVDLVGPSKNIQGIGAKIQVYTDGNSQYFENYTTRGFLSSVVPEILIGLDSSKTIDSLRVIWPDGKTEKQETISANQRITLNYTNAGGNYYKGLIAKVKTRQYVNDTLLSFKHKENPTVEFSRNPLVPYSSTNLSKAICSGDINNDGLQDFVTLGAKSQATSLQLQTTSGSFTKQELPSNDKHAIAEDIDAIIFDANGDRLNDLIIVSGGNEIQTGNALQPRLYINTARGLEHKKEAFNNTFINASTINAVDLDQDGDLDISITSDVIPQEFGTTPLQYLFSNDGSGNFSNITESYSPDFKDIGNVRDIQWQDIDDNGYPDAVVLGHWMAPTILLNDGKKLTKQDNNGLENTNGWFNSSQVADFDNDGDLDIIAGNWGLNTRLKASAAEPVQLYIQDFDDNGKLDPIVTYYYKGEETTIATKDELTKQLPQLNKKYLSYSAFAKAEFKDLLPSNKLATATIKQVTQLASVYFENNGDGTFTEKQLPLPAQVSSVHDILVDDLDNDGYKDLVLIGNDYEISTQLGRLDGSKGIVLYNDKNGFFNVGKKTKFNILGASRSIDTATISGKKYIIVGRNNDTPLFLRKED
ncbi:VCBS repeat-containing protein [uncultured Dokdonia sp.]|uniref:VCBS repeat-containing protein n=1 Tax=uncultured Dokdonia sp. TaxID=575653 RepID=UPI002622522A|nr:VCBS repeat-containing protein [uncultured Dokdonia sp.]